MRYAILRIWYDGHVDDLGEATDRATALARAKRVAASEQTVYMRAPDDVPEHPSSRRTFGALPGVRSGQRFRRRSDLQAAGVHRGSQGGIDWCPDGALAIVFAGGYVDDHWSKDDPWYTGMGGQDTRGRQVRDQEPTLGNRALLTNLREGLPVRVIRKVEASEDFEYRYEGVYHVIDYTYQPGRDGPKVFRFQLRQADL
jgi:putative restriction endonuclease